MKDGEPSTPSPVAAPASTGDAFAAMRHPIAVLIILLPLGLLGELLRWLSRDPTQPETDLFSDPMLGQLGTLIGLGRPWMAPLVLIAWCAVVLIIGRAGWKKPALRPLLMIVGWGVLWAVARCTIGLACHALLPDRVLQTTGLLLSGALQEQLLFFGLILGGMVLIGRGMGASRIASAAVSLTLTAIFFSLAHTVIVNHHPGAELFTWPAFIERFFAGLLYGYVFLRHGLATSTLAHFGYLLALEAGISHWY